MAVRPLTPTPLGVHNGPVQAVAFGPDGATIASGGDDELIRLWDVRTGRQRAEFDPRSGPVRSIAFSHDGVRLAVAGTFAKLGLFDVPSGGVLARVGSTDPGRALAFSSDGAVLANGTAGLSVQLREASTGAEISEIDLGVGKAILSDEVYVLSVALSPSGDALVACAENGSVWEWNRASDELKARRLFAADLGGSAFNRSQVALAAFSPDRAMLATCGQDGRLRVWDVPSGQPRPECTPPVGRMRSAAFSPDGTILAGGTADGIVTLWNTRTGEMHGELVGELASVLSVAFSPDGTTLVTGEHDGTVRLWDVQACTQRTWPAERASGVLSMSFSRDRNRLATSGVDGSVCLWDGTSGSPRRIFDDGRTLAVAFSPDGALLAVAGADGSVWLLDQDTGEPGAVTSSGVAVWSVAFSPDGAAYAKACDDGRVLVQDVRERSFTEVPGHVGAVWSVAFSPDGSLLASAGQDGSVRLRNNLLGGAPRVLTGHVGAVWSVAFSPDGSLLASAGQDGSVRIWDAGSLRQRAVLGGNVGAVLSLAFSPDGRVLACGGEDRMVRLWDVGTGERIADLAGHTGKVWSVTFIASGSRASPSFGRAVLASGGDDAIRTWNVTDSAEHYVSHLQGPADIPDYDQLLAGATSAVEADPLNPEALLTRASLLRDTGRLQEALADAERAAAADPANTAALVTRARVLRDLGRLDEALTLATEAAKLFPDSESLLLSKLLIRERALSRAEPQATETSPPESAPGGEAAEAVSPALLAGGYDADDADDPGRPDALGFETDVRMLCSVLADKTARPPLSVGLFGEWGSGKSFFMRLMRQRISRLAEAAQEAERQGRDTRYCSHVTQITFNAWHYMDANLWASLASEIFFRLASPDQDGVAEEEARVERQREAILRRLDTCQHLAAELTETRQRTESQREEVAKQLGRAQSQRQHMVGELAEVVAADVAGELAADPQLTKLREQAAEELGLSELAPLDLPGFVSNLRQLSGQAGATWRLLARRKGTWAVTLGLAAVFLVSLLVGLILLAARGSQWHGWTAIGVALGALGSSAVAIRPILTSVGNGLDWAEKALQREEKLVQKRQAAKRVKLEAELERLTAQEQSLTIELAAATAAAAEAKSEEEDLQADRRLRRFLEERSGSTDYRGQLGLISLLHKDFRRLDRLLGLARENTDDELPRIDRIVLYIDDLDRCPPARVVEVLQAMYLLLALPLFVVVVGVDPRWLLGSLQHHYQALLQNQVARPAPDGDASHWASMPQDYLEKIFQIPFALMPMTGGGFAQLISDLAGEVAPQPAPDGPVRTGDPRQLAPSPSAGEMISTNGTDSGSMTSPSQGPYLGLGSGRASDLGTAAAGPPRRGPFERDEDTKWESPQELGRPLSYREAQEAYQRRQYEESVNAPPPAAGEDRSTPPPPDAEEQRIPVRRGSVASLEEDHIDPNPVGLQLTEYEVRFIQALAPMVPTPRVGTRLVNIYRMIRSTQATTGPSRFLDLFTGAGDYQAVLQLLAIVSGFPDLAAPTFQALLRAVPDMTWSAFVDGLPAAGPGSGEDADTYRLTWCQLAEALAAVRDIANVQVPEDLASYREWAPRVARFSFAAARVLGASG